MMANTPWAAGTEIDPYVLISATGAGGMGEVWKARDTRLGRTVGIKRVKGKHSERFKQEAHAIAALNHSYICQLYDIGTDYLVLEYVEGKSLPSPLFEREAVRLAVNALAQIPRPKVTARSSPFAFRGKEQDITRSVSWQQAKMRKHLRKAAKSWNSIKIFLVPTRC